MTTRGKVHLRSLLPGERFRLIDEPSAPVYSVVALDVLDEPDVPTAFIDPDGMRIRSFLLSELNCGSFFVFPMPAEGDSS
jgi:hypothetical protein